MKKHLSIFLIFALAFMLLAPAQTAQAAVKLNKTKITISQGEYYTLKLTGIKSKITWTTNNKKIATVTSSGKVYGAKTGTAFITATVGNKQYTCKVLVAYPTLKNHTVKLRYGEIYQVEINNLPAEYTYDDLKFKLTNMSSVEAIQGGKLKAVLPGITQVTISFGKYKLYQTIEVENFNSDELNSFVASNADIKFAEFNNQNIYIVKGLSQNISLNYVFEYYNGNELISVSSSQFVDIYKDRISTINVPAIDKVYTSVKLRYASVYINPITLKKPDVSMTVTEPYDYYYKYYIGGQEFHSTLNTFDLNIMNNTKERQGFGATVVFYKAGKVVNVKYYKASLDIGTTIVKESAISDNRLSGDAYNPEYDNYEIFY